MRKLRAPCDNFVSVQNYDAIALNIALAGTAPVCLATMLPVLHPHPSGNCDPG